MRTGDSDPGVFAPSHLACEKTPMSRAFRVCIDARMGPRGSFGGVQQVVIGLAAGLAEIAEEGEEYHFLVDAETAGWLGPFLSEPCRLLRSDGPEVVPPSNWRRIVKATFPKFVIKALSRTDTWLDEFRPVHLPRSNGVIERAGMDVLHQALQFGFTTEIPCIYVPHDLQHVHLPELFSAADRRRKAVFYPSLARRAAAVIALSRWGMNDLVQTLGLPSEKVWVVHNAAAVDAYPEPTESDLATLRERLAIPGPFALYPAQTWRHKNHLGLLACLARLRDRQGLEVPVVFTGHLNEFFPVIEQRVVELGLQGQVRILGFVSPTDMKALYRLCRMMVFPSRFEGFGMPVVEAFRLGVPVACSNSTSLPEVADDAAVLFDADDVASMAAAVTMVWSDPDLRAELVARGLQRARSFTWLETARRCRALYRLVGQRPLDEGDRRLLQEMRG
jgi:glycosyltransferase involved in cell wall biosynthesis